MSYSFTTAVWFGCEMQKPNNSCRTRFLPRLPHHGDLGFLCLLVLCVPIVYHQSPIQIPKGAPGNRQSHAFNCETIVLLFNQKSTLINHDSTKVLKVTGKAGHVTKVSPLTTLNLVCYIRSFCPWAKLLNPEQSIYLPTKD